MSGVATPEVEAFDRAFGLIIEGACPADESRLERREGWGYAFCVECGEGWLAGTGDVRYVSRLGGHAYWFEGGACQTMRTEMTSSGLLWSIALPSMEQLPTAGVSG